ncbi:hypothetical protein KC799_25915 [candidate division KSB1 bacterium]|nr:hypothetical protein [candidate division KSB1 bacterium]
MKKLNSITLVMLIACIFVLFFTLLDFAALHDIFYDYISQRALDYLHITTSELLPEWTQTIGEWQIVTVGLFLRFIFLILNSILLFFHIKLPKNAIDKA